MPLTVYIKPDWYEFSATDERGDAPTLVLVSDDNGSSGVVIPVERQIIVSYDVAEPKEDEPPKAVPLEFQTDDLPVETLAFLASTFCDQAARVAKKRGQTIPLSPDKLADWGYIHG